MNAFKTFNKLKSLKPLPLSSPASRERACPGLDPGMYGGGLNRAWFDKLTTLSDVGAQRLNGLNDLNV